MKKGKIISTIIIALSMILSLSSCKKTNSVPKTNPTISYQDEGTFGTNILDLNKTSYVKGKFDIEASLSVGANLKIKITALSPVTGILGLWWYDSSSPINWNIGNLDLVNNSQTLTSIESSKTCDVAVLFPNGTFLIEYFEENATTPTRSKTITIN
jgi:hypothetical protein